MISMCMDCKRRLKNGRRHGVPLNDFTIELLRVHPGISDGLCSTCHKERKKELSQYRKEKQCEPSTKS